MLHYLRDKAAIIRLPRALQTSYRDVGAGFNATTQQRRLVPLDNDLISQEADLTSELFEENIGSSSQVRYNDSPDRNGSRLRR